MGVVGRCRGGGGGGGGAALRGIHACLFFLVRDDGARAAWAEIRLGRSFDRREASCRSAASCGREGRGHRRFRRTREPTRSRSRTKMMIATGHHRSGRWHRDALAVAREPQRLSPARLLAQSTRPARSRKNRRCSQHEGMDPVRQHRLQIGRHGLPVDPVADTDVEDAAVHAPHQLEFALRRVVAVGNAEFMAQFPPNGGGTTAP